MDHRASILRLPDGWPRLSRCLFFVMGGLLATAFAPYGWYLFAPLLLLPFLYVCLTVAPRDAGGLTFWFGFGLFLSGTYWIYISVAVFGNVSAWIAVSLTLGVVLIMSAYLSLTGWLISRLSYGEPWLLLFVAPASWVMVEWLRGWVLSGFPWLSLGYSQIDSPLAGWGPVAGVYGISFALLFSVSAILVMALTRGKQRWVALVLVALPWIAGGLLKNVAWTDSAGAPIRSTLVQAGISQDRKWLPEQLQPTLEFYRAATQRVADSEIVVWPEAAIPSVTDRVEPFIAQLHSDAQLWRQTILFGVLERVQQRGETHTYNSILLVGTDQRQVYRKRHLVPFGEYFPVPDTVREWLRMMNLPYSDLSAGDAEQPLLVTANGVRLALVVCYEDAFGAEQLYAFPDAAIIINQSNDAWFGDSIAPHQHLQIARMRSLEVGRYTIRATNTGISAFIGPDGKILKSGPQFEPLLLTMDVQPRRGATPYVRGGNMPVIGLCLFILSLLSIRSRAWF
ncbi:MAG: apolipoprotein N-acyltransferase [Proteobacteria bacterium]|nr:apolipoprotein N-acyltransferase [Pseudomonadota bacterium]